MSLTDIVEQLKRDVTRIVVPNGKRVEPSHEYFLALYRTVAGKIMMRLFSGTFYSEAIACDDRLSRILNTYDTLITTRQVSILATTCIHGDRGSVEVQTLQPLTTVLWDISGRSAEERLLHNTLSLRLNLLRKAASALLHNATTPGRDHEISHQTSLEFWPLL